MREKEYFRKVTFVGGIKGPVWIPAGGGEDLGRCPMGADGSS